MKTKTLHFADDGDIPNNRVPLILYVDAIGSAEKDAAAAFERLFAAHGWGGGWRNGIFPFHHYHSTAHEVLGIAAGEAEVLFGGEKGQVVRVRAGDAVLIPAGVGHKRLSASPDLLVVGAYPGGAWADLMREGAAEGAAIRQRIAAVPAPESDPIAGAEGPMRDLWR